MADLLKDVYNPEFLAGLADKIKAAWSPFDAERFMDETLREPWDSLALKQRMRKITLTLGALLPDRYGDALAILLQVHEGFSGLSHLVFPDFVEVYGVEEADWERSMHALEAFTVRCSSEFAVRPFLIRDPERMMRQMLAWAGHPNEHVRRLASEGCRPRLPWGQALPAFKKDPAPIVPVLERLKADPSLYVRKSVANNLNDIAKDNPDIVLELARGWLGSDPRTDWIVRHGCRTLIRKAHPAVMELFGYGRDESQDGQLVTDAAIAPDKKELHIGDSCLLTYEVNIRDGDAAKVRVEYGIDFVKSGGRTSRKLFLLSDKTVAGGGRITGSRTHRWANLSTRRHYPGVHRIVLLVNGREAAETSIVLAAPQLP